MATVSVTRVPAAACVPAGGSCSSTVPGSASASSRSLRAHLRSRRRASAASAWSCGWPTTSGTAVFSLPRETTSVTVEPLRTDSPSAGEVSITRSFLTVSEYSSLRSVRKPASRIWSVASSTGRPWTSGTSASPGPVETLIVTSDPTSASSPGAGSWPATRSSSTVSDWSGTTFTSKPSRWRICVAFSARLSTTLGTGLVSVRSSR